MRRPCVGGYVVKYGDTVEVFLENGKFLYSFRASSDLCRDMLTRYLVIMAGMNANEKYTFKKRGR